MSKFINSVKLGDVLTILFFIAIVTLLFIKLINLPEGEFLEIETNNESIIFNLEHDIQKKFSGPLGLTEIIIHNKKARIKESSCNKKYCVHHGWINKINETIVCIPNEVRISIIGKNKPYDSTNY
jgi:hypothetical protein